MIFPRAAVLAAATAVACANDPATAPDGPDVPRVVAPDVAGYEAIDLGTPGSWARPRSLNNNARVVGWGSATEFGRFPWIWDNGVMSELPYPCCTTNAVADAINNSSLIAGVVALDNEYSLILWDGEQQHTASLGTQVLAMVVDLSENGHVLVSFGEPGSMQAAVWSGGEIETIGHLATPAFTEPRDINSRRQVVGRSLAFYAEPVSPDVPNDFDERYAFFHPFVWESGVTTDLGVLGVAENCTRTSPCASGDALAINDAGHAVGYAENDNFIRRPFVWRGGAIQELEVFPGENAVARAINNQGQVAGDATSGVFYWDNGSSITSNALGGRYTRVTDMNENGDIVGTAMTAAGEQHAFMWSGSSLVDFGVGIIGAAAAKAISVNDRGDVLVLVTNECFRRDDGTCDFSFNRVARAVLFRRQM